jgi:hypothetical protein
MPGGWIRYCGTSHTLTPFLDMVIFATQHDHALHGIEDHVSSLMWPTGFCRVPQAAAEYCRSGPFLGDDHGSIEHCRVHLMAAKVDAQTKRLTF